MVFSLKIDYSGLSVSSHNLLRYRIFGRVVVSSHNGVGYYYPGLFNSLRYFKLSGNEYLIDRPIVIPSDLRSRLTLRTVPTSFDFSKCYSGRDLIIQPYLFKGIKIKECSE